MKTLKLFSALFLILFSLSSHSIDLTDSASTPYISEKERTQVVEFQKFLTAMGYDKKWIIEQLLSTKELTAAQIKAQDQRYEIVETTKDLASVILAKAIAKMPNANIESKLIELTTRLLTLGIRGLPDQLPANLRAITDAQEKQKRASEFIINYANQAINDTRQDLMGDITNVFYSADDIIKLEKTKDPAYLAAKKDLNKVITDLTLHLYTDLELTQSRFLGRALTLGLIRCAKLNNRPQILKALEKSVSEKGENLHNYVSNTYTGSKDGEIIKVPLVTNDRLTVKKAKTEWKNESEEETLASKIFNFFSNPNRDLIKNFYESNAVVLVKEDEKLDLQVVWVVTVDPTVKVGDINSFAPPGFTYSLELKRPQGLKTVINNLRDASFEARQLLFYGATRSAMDPGVRLLIAKGLNPIELSFAQATILSETTLNSPEFQYLLSRPANQKTINGVNKNLSNIQKTNLTKLNETEMKKFLFELGFRDWTAETKEYYEKGYTYNKHTQKQQVRNMISYQAINSARELAIFLMSRAQDRIANGQDREQILDLAANFLSQQPMSLVKKLPPEIESLLENEKVEDKVKSKAVDALADKLVRPTMYHHAKLLTSDILQFLYTENVLKNYAQNKLDSKTASDITASLGFIWNHVLVLVDRMYLDKQTGQSRFLGRALIALLYRFDEINQLNTIPKEAAVAAQDYNLKIENFIGDTLLLDDNSGKPTPVKVEDFAYVLFRAVSTESTIIPFGAIPSNEERAKSRGLMASPLAIAFVVTPDDVSHGYSQASQWKDQAYYKWLKDGYSHIGYFFIKKAKNSNIKMAWVIDNYPHPTADSEDEVENAEHNAGGLRIMGLEQFYMTSHHSRLYIGNFDRQKFYEYAMSEKAKNGVPKSQSNVSIFTSYKTPLDSSGKPVIVPDSQLEKAEWKLTTQQAQLDDLYASKNASEFWSKYMHLIETGFEQNIKMGMTFIWITPYGKYYYGSAYCSSTADVISRQMTGLSVEQEKSKWHSIVGTITSTFTDLNAIENEDLKNIAMMGKMGIISPSSLANQPYMQDGKTVDAPFNSVRFRTHDDFSLLVAGKPWMVKLIEDNLSHDQVTYFTTKKLDPTEIRTLSYDIQHIQHAKGIGGYGQ